MRKTSVSLLPRGQWVCDKSRAFCGRTHVKLGNRQKLIFLKNANILNPFQVLCVFLCVCKIKA